VDQEKLDDLMDELYRLASRREALSIASKIAIAGAAGSLLGGLAGYLLGSSLRREVTRTETETRYETITRTATETETQTITETLTITKTETRTITKTMEEEALEWAYNTTPLTYASLSKKLGNDFKKIGGRFIILARNPSTSFDQKILSKQNDSEFANAINYHPDFVYFSVREGKLRGDFDQDGLSNELVFSPFFLLL